MKAATKVRSRKTGRVGWRYRITDPRTGRRTHKTVWLSNRRDADKGLQIHLEEMESRAIGLPDHSGWRMAYPDLVKKFLQEAPISTDKRREFLQRVLEANPLGLLIGADLAHPGRLTAGCRKMLEARHALYIHRHVQAPLKQLARWGASCSLLPYDPLSAWRRLPGVVQKSHRRAFTPEEAKHVFEAAAELDGIYKRKNPSTLVFKALLFSGNRPSAMFGAKKSDLRDYRVHLPHGTGKKRNGMAFLPPGFVDGDLKRYLEKRGDVVQDDRLLVSHRGEPLDRKNIRDDFKRATILAFVRECWPAGEGTLDPVEVAEAIHKGRVRGFDGPKPKDPAKIEKNEAHARRVAALMFQLEGEVQRRLEGKDMYSLRKTHISWARRLVRNHDSVKLQVGHAPQDLEERHYLDLELVDARESAQAVYDVFTRARSLSGETTKRDPMLLAVGAEDLSTEGNSGHVAAHVGEEMKNAPSERRVLNFKGVVNQILNMVGAAGFEPTTSCSPRVHGISQPDATGHVKDSTANSNAQHTDATSGDRKPPLQGGKWPRCGPRSQDSSPALEAHVQDMHALDKLDLETELEGGA